MPLTERQKESRRSDMLTEFPLEDGQGVIVIQNRRQLPDRRKAELSIDDLKVMLSETEGVTKNKLIFVSLIMAINTAFILMVYALIMATK